MTELMKGKRGLIMGLANDKSIAWGIAQELHKHGAELAFSYPTSNLEKRVRPLAESLDSKLILTCDVTSDFSIKEMMDVIEAEWGGLDFIVHAIAFSDKNELQGRYVETTRDNFNLSLDVSCYSLTAVVQAAEKILNNHASIITLSYYGAEKVVPNYNVMGVAKAALEASVRYLAADLGGEKQIRVNSISAGPIRTMAASAITGFKRILEANEQNSPLRRNVDASDVGKTAVWLLSDLSSGVTGENIYVDGGANTVGLHLDN